MSQPWMAPDSPAEPAPPAAAVPAPAGTAGSRRRDQGRPEVPVPLRPLSSVERLDGALRILKLAPGTVAAVVVTAMVPVELLAAVLLRDEDASLARVLVGATAATLVDESGAGPVGPVLFILLDALALGFVAAALAQLVTGWHVGRRDGTADLLRATAARLPAIGGAVLLVKLAEAAGALALGVGALVPMTWFAVALPVVGAERAGPVAALRRAAALTRRHAGSVFATCLLSAVVSLVLRLSLSTLGGFYVDAGLPAGWLVATLLGLGVRIVVDPLVAGAAVLTYLDLRVRREGLDIELAAIDRLRRAS